MQPQSALQKYFGYTSYKPGQQAVIEAVLSGCDTLAILGTGAGKSICYQVPALCMQGTCIVISPLIALMRDQVLGLHKRDITAVALTSGISGYQLARHLEEMQAGKYKFVFVSPERAKSEQFRAYLQDTQVCLLAVDEAHCVSHWGYDFRPPYLHIAELRAYCKSALVLALTASATQPVQADIVDKLKLCNPIIVKGSTLRSNIAIACMQVQSKHTALLHTLSKVSGAVVVYCRNRGTCVKVSEFLSSHQYNAAFYHAGLSTAQRTAVQDDWVSGNTPIICCTNAFGMGIDKANVRLIVHYDSPDSIEAYYQEIGRAGRDGAPAEAVLLYTAYEYGDVQQLAERRYPPLNFIRDTYQLVMDYLRVAYDEGEGQSVDFDLVHCAKTIELDVIKLSNALRFLELQQLLQVSESIYTPSKVQCIASREQLDFIEQFSVQRDAVLKALLRLYGGIFYDAVNVNEVKIAQFAEVDMQDIRGLLHELHKQEIIVYTEAKDKPQLLLLRERLHTYDIHLDVGLLNFLRNNYEQQLGAAYAYYTNTEACRALIIAQYFGEQLTKPCGICNNCLQHKADIAPAKNAITLQQEIKHKLVANSMSIIDLQGALQHYIQAEVLASVQQLLEEDAIVYNKKGEIQLR